MTVHKSTPVADSQVALPPVRLATSIGESWLQAAELILASGLASSWDDVPNLEVLQLTLIVTKTDANDPLIARYGDADRLAWMHANFHDHSRVAELSDADSYATRLYDYARSGRDQLAWVVERLRNDPTTRDATITTFQPLTDTTYIPCVSLLDFWIVEGRLQLGAYAHGIDFGTKGYANLVELAYIQEVVAQRLEVPVGHLTFTVKSAHIYDSERDAMLETVRAAGASSIDETPSSS